jgi:hypothetical protein
MLNVNLHNGQLDESYNSRRQSKSNGNNSSDHAFVDNGNGNSCVPDDGSDFLSPKLGQMGVTPNRPKFCEPYSQLEKSSVSAKRFSEGMQTVDNKNRNGGSGFVNIDYAQLQQRIKRSAAERQSVLTENCNITAAEQPDRSPQAECDSCDAERNHHRVVADIRNNIPRVDVAGCYNGVDNTPESLPSMTAQLRIELSQMKKRSPGVAKRLDATTPSKSDSGDFAKDCEQPAVKVSCGNVQVEVSPSNNGRTTEPVTDSVSCNKLVSVDLGSKFGQEPYSNTVNRSFAEGGSDCSSDETRLNVDPFHYSDVLHNAILFDSFDDCATDDRTFTLSPDQSDCESDDAYGELDEEGRASEGSIKLTSMPAVEDGLSGSDTDDHVSTRQRAKRPEAAVTSTENASSCGAGCVSELEVTEFFSGSVNEESISERLQEEKVEQAIRDIYRAMERNKNVSSSSGMKGFSSASDDEQIFHQDKEPVWVVRSR